MGEDPPKLKKPVVFEAEVEGGLLFKFNLPVITAKKTKTTTKPKTKKNTLLKLTKKYLL